MVLANSIHSSEISWSGVLPVGRGTWDAPLVIEFLFVGLSEGFASVPPVRTIWRQLGVLHHGCDWTLGAAEWPLKTHGSPLLQRP
jgi:hypothetical protein